MVEVDVGGMRLAYRVLGADDAPPMILLHGLGSGGVSWAGIAEAFAVSHRVYLPDLRGHGASGWPGEYSFELMRDDVLGFLDALGLDRVVLVGHSMGGSVALLFAEAYPARLRLAADHGDSRPTCGARAGLVGRDQRDSGADADHRGWSGQSRAAGQDRPGHGPYSGLSAGDDSVGHQVHRDRPAEFVAAVLEFLG